MYFMVEKNQQIVWVELLRNIQSKYRKISLCRVYYWLWCALIQGYNYLNDWRLKYMGNRAVLYLRLSKEDADKVNKGDDSSSIKSQRLMLTDYALEKGFKIVKVYSDDDESGLYDDRPGFEEMILDAKMGEYDVIIAKSQSRFSRNM